MSLPYDLAVIGAGITGAGMFAAACRAGLRTVLLERDRPGQATTAVTSGLLHGGLRYLPYDASVSRAMAREAGSLSRAYPQLVARQVFLWPVYRGHRFGLGLVESLLELYDELADARGARRHVRLRAAEALELEPGLRPEGLLGALAFDEWRVEVAGLMSALVADGRAAGGELREDFRVASVLRESGALRLCPAGSPGRDAIRARVAVNAGGPWAEEVARLAGCRDLRLSLRKGVHLALDGNPARHGLIFPGPGGRYIGLYPRPAGAWVGPTDAPFAGKPGEAAGSHAEGCGLRDALARVLPRAPREWRALPAGLRPLLRRRGPAALLSRDYAVVDHEREGCPRLVTVAGGKLTLFRPMADEALGLVLAKLGRGAAPTATRPTRSAAGEAALSALGLAARALRHLARRARGERREGLALFRREYGHA